MILRKLRSLVLCLTTLSILCAPLTHDARALPQFSESASPHTGRVFCRIDGIKGFDVPRARAEKIIGPETTSDPSKMRAFITVESGSLYIQTNFITPGATFPTKLATNVPTDLDMLQITYNLVGKEEESGIPQEETVGAYPKVLFAVDDKVFADSTWSKLNFNDSENVLVIGRDGTIRPSKEIALTTGENKRVVQFEQNLLWWAGDPRADEIFHRLKSDPFDRGSIKMLSLVINSDTDKAISANIPRDVVVDSGDKSISSVRTTFAQNSGKSMFILGHIEGDFFVIRDAKGKEISRLSIKELNDAAKESRVRLFPLGCNSAKTAAAGVASAFNTVDAVKRFGPALKEANTWGDFYQKLASPHLILVLDYSILDEKDKSGSATFAVYKKGKGPRGTPEPVGTIIHDLPPLVVAGPPMAPLPPQQPDDSSFPWGWIVFGAVVLAIISRKVWKSAHPT